MAITGEFSELQEELVKIKNDVDISISRVTDFRSDWDDLIELRNKIDSFSDRIVDLQKKLLDASTTNRTVDIFYRRALEEAKDTLKQFVIEAAGNSDEYSRPLLKDPLVKACDSGGIITLQLTKDGWNSTVKATANLDEVMGTLEQWASAVSRVREENDWSMGNDPIKSSAIWRDSIFLGHSNRNRKTSGGNTNKSSNWSNTIMQRLDMAGSPAPFWELLNYGQMRSMSSDWGGIPFPKDKPSFFKENAEKQIELDFKSDMESARVSWIKFAEKVQGLWDLVNSLRSKVISALQSMERETASATYEELPIKKVVSGLRLNEEQINYNKLLLVIDELTTKGVEGEITVVRVTKAGRIEITMKGGPRKRISVKKLRAFLGG